MESILNNIHQIQELERNILREVIRVCEENSIPYFMAEGSLLGAVRHQGVIPWDDDIDIAMFRQDYERFMEIAPAALGRDFELQSYRSHAGYMECMAKIIDRRYKVRSFAKSAPFDTNLWIDLFVIDGFPVGKLSGKLHKFRLLRTKLMLMWSDVDHYAQDRKRPFYETLLIQVARKLHFSRWISTLKWQKRLDRVMASVPVTPEGNTVIFISEYRFRTMVPASVYGAGRQADFDGIQVRIPEQAETLLTQVYGDYMQLPPEGSRYKHQLELLESPGTND